MFGKFQPPKRGEIESKFRKLYQLGLTLLEIVRLLSDEKFSSVLKGPSENQALIMPCKIIRLNSHQNTQKASLHFTHVFGTE